MPEHSAVARPSRDRVDVLMFEYERAESMLRHYDNLNWQIGSILLGASLVVFGFALEAVAASEGKVFWGVTLAAWAVVLGAPGLSFAALRLWYRWFTRHRDLYNLRNEVMHRIEFQLGMYHALLSAEHGKRGRLTPEEEQRLTEARSRAGYDDFTPLFDLTKAAAPSGVDTARRLHWLIPLVQLVVLLVVAVTSSLT